jgi:hypothetical protein
MSNAGLSIGGIGGIGLGNAVTLSISSVGAAPGPTPASISIKETLSSPPAGVVVTLSNAGLQALTLASAATANGTGNSTQTSSKQMDDLVAATLLAILQRDQQQNTPGANDLSVAAAAINAYLAVQALGGGG